MTNPTILLWQDATKFELCDTLRIILRSFPKTEFDDVIAAEWLSRVC